MDCAAIIPTASPGYQDWKANTLPTLSADMQAAYNAREAGAGSVYWWGRAKAIEGPSAVFQNQNDTSKSVIEDTEVVKQIKELIDQRVRPAVAMDGGDISFCSFENGVVTLQMKGACAGCPSSTATLKMGIENMLRHYIPEVLEVKAAEL